MAWTFMSNSSHRANGSACAASPTHRNRETAVAKTALGNGATVRRLVVLRSTDVSQSAQ